MSSLDLPARPSASSDGGQPSAGRSLVALARNAAAGFRLLLVLTLVLGVAYPLAVTGVAKVAFGWQAAGSLVRADGTHTSSRSDAVGSALIGQDFGAPAAGAQWFHGRPSVGGYDTLASGGSNLGPLSPELVATIEARRAAVAAADGVAPATVPPDAVTASASGLDPDISPAYAREQVTRVAAARGLDAAAVQRLVAEHTAGRTLGYLGESRVDVVELNIAVAALAAHGTSAG